MKKEKLNVNRLVIILAAIITTVAVAVCIITVVSRPKAPASYVPVYGEDGKPFEGEVIKNDHSISAPGYGMLEMKAGKNKQGFALSNPVQNNCYMKISIVLADGTVLWTSKPTAPGAATDEVVLTPALAAGRYDDVKLIYDCFRDEECTQELNSAVIGLYIEAK